MRHMAVVQVAKNSPVKGDVWKEMEEARKKNLDFYLDMIVQSLHKNYRRQLAERFSDELVKLGYTEQYISMIRTGRRTLGNDAMKRLLVNSPEALKEALGYLKAQIEWLEMAMSTLENADLSLLKEEYPPKRDEEEEGEEE